MLGERLINLIRPLCLLCCCCSVVKACLTLLWHHGLKPARLHCPWDIPGKSTGEGCHFLLQGNLPNPGIKPMSPALAGGFLTMEPPGKPTCLCQLLFIHFRLLLSLWTWDIGIGIICFLIITFRGMAPRNLRKTFLSRKIGKGLLRRFICILKSEKELSISSFPK